MKKFVTCFQIYKVIGDIVGEPIISIVDNELVFLGKGYYVEKLKITKEEAQNIKSNYER